jgi:hypothetical protein
LAAKDEKFVADLNAAAELFNQGKYYESYMAYQTLTGNIQAIYSYSLVGVGGGDSIAFLASKYNSTMQAIRTQNGLGDSLSVQFTQTLNIPSIP